MFAAAAAVGGAADADAAGGAAREEGDEGPEAGDAGADDAHGWFGRGPDGGVDVVPCVGALLLERDIFGGREWLGVQVTSTEASLESTTRRMMLMMQTLA